jgi:NAD(P)H-nitrite reductase large subunit
MLRMEPDGRELCLCFHVPLGKLVKYYRLHQPQLVSQFAQCHSAGTGCGWCVPFLERLFEQLQQGDDPQIAMSIDEYKARRQEYFRSKKPELPPPPDAEHPLTLDLDELLDDIDDGLKLD